MPQMAPTLWLSILMLTTTLLLLVSTTLFFYQPSPKDNPSYPVLTSPHNIWLW